LTSLARRICPDAHIHVDLVQSYGKIPFDFGSVDVDSVAIAAHKLHGPRGVGFLAFSNNAEIHPLQPAGGQELGLRGGTENVAGAVGLAVAAEAAFTHMAESRAHTETLAGDLFDRLLEAFPDAVRLGDPDHHLPHILSMRIPGVVGATILKRMDAHGVAFSTGSACHGPNDKGNHVHEAIGLSRREAREVMRVSFCRFNTKEELDRVAKLMKEEVSFLLDHAPSSGKEQGQAR
jgi:cysteine desulfurase